MNELDLYILILCLIVYVALVSFFSVLTVVIARMSLRLIRIGAEDERIIKEHRSSQEKRRGCLVSIFDKTVSIVICMLLVACLLVSVTATLSERGVCCASLPCIRVVKSASMATREESNEYLFANGLTDQIQTFDLIFTHSIPPEDELALYDIVVYEVKGEYIIHRIVGIEEPNEKHPDERYFLLQGDAVRFSDKFPVKYEQMLGIYRGERIAAVGSFVAFMQSPAGFLCFILALFTIISIPVLERKFKKEEILRLEILEASGALCNTENTLHTSALVTPKAEPEAEVEPEERLKNEEEIRHHSVPLGRSLKKSRKKRDIDLFKKRLSLLEAESLRYYNRICEELEAYRELRYSYSKTYRTFRLGGAPMLRLTARGRTLYCYLTEKCGFAEELKKVVSYNPNEKYPYALAVVREDIADLILRIISSAVAAIPKEKRKGHGELVTVAEDGLHYQTFRFTDE